MENGQVTEDKRQSAFGNSGRILDRQPPQAQAGANKRSVPDEPKPADAQPTPEATPKAIPTRLCNCSKISTLIWPRAICQRHAPSQPLKLDMKRCGCAK